jgi:hypothetical protein
VRAGLRRLLLLFAVVGGTTALLSAGLGALAGGSTRRSIAVGLYLVGSILLIAGFFVGNRGVLRSEGDSGGAGGLFGGLGRGRVRTATGHEQRESLHVSALVIGLGMGLLILGVVADTENSLI